MDAPISTAPRALHLDDPSYPPRLRVLAPPPERVWLRGAWAGTAQAVAVVGARAATLRGVERAIEVANLAAREGIEVVSGGAVGIDAGAHRGALQGGGATLAVLGTGIDQAYPSRHQKLFSEIVTHRGALLSQFPPGQGPQPWAFPLRNRLIAALADVVIVVEAAASSGSLYTARAAQQLGRPVGAWPGTAGADRLILDGAVPLSSPSDALRLLRGQVQEPPRPPADPDARRLYDSLDRVARDLGELSCRAGLPLGSCAAALLDLELGGFAARAAGGRYLRLR